MKQIREQSFQDTTRRTFRSSQPERVEAAEDHRRDDEAPEDHCRHEESLDQSHHGVDR
jgi:hypothetical protein